MKNLLVRTLDQPLTRRIVLRTTVAEQRVSSSETRRVKGPWRDWLIEHHASESEVWLIFHKRHTGVASIDYKDALDEALCFGWVDSLVKRLDDRPLTRRLPLTRQQLRRQSASFARTAVSRAGGSLESSRRGEPTADGRL